MTTFPINETKIKMAWREKYLTDGANEQALAHPRGLYRGFWLSPRLAPDRWLRLIINPYAPGDAIDKDQFAVYRHTDNSTGVDGFAVSIRETMDIEFDCEGMWPGVGMPLAADEDWYVYIEASYSPNVVTAANYRVENTDPRIANPDAVILGVIPMHMGDMTFVFTAFPPTAGMYTIRTYPVPSEVDLPASIAGGEEMFGFLDMYKAWRVPTFDQKGAMNNALTTPDASNPFVTVADVMPMATRILAEPVLAEIVSTGTDHIDLPSGAVLSYYVGLGAAPGSATYYFDIHAHGTQFPMVDTMQRWIRVVSVHKIVGGADVGVLTPSVDADANGFYPAAPGAGNTVRLYFGYEDASAAIVTGVTVDVWCEAKNWLSLLQQNPASAFPMAARPRFAHANEHLIRGYYDPPMTPRFAFASAQDGIRFLQRQGRGSAFSGMTDEDVAAKAEWDYLEPDTHPFNGTNTEEIASAVIYRHTMTYAFFNGTRYLCYSGWFLVPAVAFVDLETYAAVIGYAVPDGPGGNWAGYHVVSMCSDGRYVYIRLYNDATHDHYVTCMDPFTGLRRSTWPAAGCDIGNGTFALVDDGYAEDLIVADAYTLAANRTWQNIDTPGTDDAVVLINKTNGTIVATGKGDYPDGIGEDVYAEGGMCSDGTNVYYSTHHSISGEGHGVRQCKISNPTQSTVSGWQVRHAFDPFSASSIKVRSLLYDGFYVWQNVSVMSGDPQESYVMAVDPRLVDSFGDSMPMYYLAGIGSGIPSPIGPAVFDGKYLYFGVAKDMGPGVATGMFHMVRLDPGRLAYKCDADGDMWDLIISQWACRSNEESDFYGDTPWGPIVFDGEDLLFLPEYDPTCVEPPGPVLYVNMLMRIRMLKYRH